MPTLTASTCAAPVKAFFLITVFSLITHLSPVAAEIRELESKTDQWLQLKQQTARERIKWHQDRQILEGSLAVLRAENDALQKRAEVLESANALYLNNQRSVERRLGEHQAKMELLAEFVRASEQLVADRAVAFPEPLRREIQPTLDRFLKDGEPLPNRLQNLISVLATIDQFNNSIRLHHQIRRDPDGTEYSARVLYWGLAQAFAVDVPGRRAWLVRPYQGAWVWEPAHEHAARIKRLVDVYENEETPSFVALPVTFQED